MAIYQDYRPGRFADVLGQEQSIQILRSQAKTGNFGHAYLMYGASGTGKTSTARILAMAVICQNMNGMGEPCGECQDCKGIREGRHWDVQELDGAQFSGIDAIRELKYRAYLSPLSGRKVYIIDEAHRLSENAWDGLLKLLEEPPPYLVIILCSTQADKIPLTVKSRTQLYPFNTIRAEHIRGKLEAITAAFGVELDLKHLQFIVECSCGNMRSAENLLEQVLVVAKENRQ